MQDFGRGFARITEDSQGFSETLGEDLQGFVRLWERILQVFMENLGEDSQGIARLWERIRKILRIRKDSRDFGRGFARIQETLGEDSQGFVRL